MRYTRGNDEDVAGLRGDLNPTGLDRAAVIARLKVVEVSPAPNRIVAEPDKTAIHSYISLVRCFSHLLQVMP